MTPTPEPSDRPTPFDAAVQAAFASLRGASEVDGHAAEASPAAARALTELLELLREAPLDRPSAALRSQVERLFAAEADGSPVGSGLAAVLRQWLHAASKVTMELISPGSGSDGLVPSLAGFRGAAAPIRSYRALTELTDELPAMDAWLDLQVELIEQGSNSSARLRGQITCEGGIAPSVVHVLDAESGDVIGGAAIAADGTFAVSTQSKRVSLAIELEDQRPVLTVGPVVLRT
jgi:hypothetical protein